MEALRLMEQDPKRPYSVIPVLEGNNFMGIIRLHDIFKEGLK